MTAVWLIADLHFGHLKVSELRGFRDPQEHDDFIAVKWRRMIQPLDEVWVLGDISAGGSEAQLSALAKLLVLPGRKHLVAGNHDGVHPMHGRKAVQWMPFYLDVFDYVCSAAKLRLEGKRLFLSHFPRQADHTAEIRYPEWRPIAPQIPENWVIHGHTHSTEKVNMAMQEICVGVDAWGFKPVNIGEIGKIIKANQSE